ncbi:hypothetical protein AAC387_Pa07g3363 [Persea americana]
MVDIDNIAGKKKRDESIGPPTDPPQSPPFLGPHPLPPPLSPSPVLFLIFAYNLASVSPPLISLHGDLPSSSEEDDPMLAAFHSFTSSLSLTPLTRFAASTALKQHQQPKEKTPVSIWVLLIESNHHIMVEIDHITK